MWGAIAVRFCCVFVLCAFPVSVGAHMCVTHARFETPQANRQSREAGWEEELPQHVWGPRTGTYMCAGRHACVETHVFGPRQRFGTFWTFWLPKNFGAATCVREDICVWGHMCVDQERVSGHFETFLNNSPKNQFWHFGGF